MKNIKKDYVHGVIHKKNYKRLGLLKKLFFLMLSIISGHLFGFAQVYFTPRDDIKTYLIQLIKEESV